MDTEPTIRESVAQLLASGEAKRLRIATGLSQTQFGVLVGGAAKGTVCKWESGDRLPSTPVCARLAELYLAWQHEDEA